MAAGCYPTQSNLETLTQRLLRELNQRIQLQGFSLNGNAFLPSRWAMYSTAELRCWVIGVTEDTGLGFDRAQTLIFRA
jgi:hypothetical protein